MSGRVGSALSSVRSWPATRAAAGVRTAAGVVAEEGPTTEPFRLASVTKLVVAVAVLVAVEEEVLDLDEPAGPPGASVRHLLAHASGLGPEREDPVVEPGRRRIYSNAGYEVLGELLAERAAMSVERYVHEAVCLPLGMSATTLEGSPAHGARASVVDLLALAGELLEPGRVLAAATVRDATEPFLADLRGVLPGYGPQDPNPWGLGPEIRGSKTPHWTPAEASARTFGHFGQSGTLVWVDPEPAVALVALCDHPFGGWALDAWPALGSAVLTSCGGRT